jgi:hypothetical protein
MRAQVDRNTRDHEVLMKRSDLHEAAMGKVNLTSYPPFQFLEVPLSILVCLNWNGL